MSASRGHPPPESEGDVNLSEHRRAWLDEQIDPSTRRILDEDERYFLRQSLSTPCMNVLEACDGIYLQDAQGRRYMDFHGNSVHQVGFGHPRVVEAITEQMRKLSFCTRRYTNAVAVELAKKLVDITPGDLSKALFAPGGTSAVGLALKLARMATGRHKTISMWDSFHGASLDAISIGGAAGFRRNAGPLLPGAEHVPYPHAGHCLFGCGGECNTRCADYVEFILRNEGDIAAVIAEPTRSAAIFPPADYWRKVRDACDRYGALLIFDEIPHALGRTGRMFAYEHDGVDPDILVLGKGLGGGIFPFAAVLARGELDVAPDAALGHYTHEKNPVACAAALATLQVIEEEGLLERSSTLGEHALQRLRAMADRHGVIGEARGRGLLLGVELIEAGDPSKPANDLADRVMYAALTKGLSFKVTMGNVLSLAPPLTITQDELDRALDIVDECLREAAG
ncbi:aspartate aminotransferase family protein [Candidatus Poribacteria bacterium]|nr:aspartate aminotransferase family protein [Candidatus Poribacteria bacterium]